MHTSANLTNHYLGAPPRNFDKASLRILAVIPGDGTGATMVFARRQVISLRRLGFDVEMFFLRSRTSPWKIMLEWKRFGRVLRTFRPDIVHAHYGTVTSFLCSAGTTLPLVITFRGDDLNGQVENTRLRSLAGYVLSQLSCLRAAKVICVSQQLRKRLWWRRSDAVVLTSGVDLNLFHPQPKEEARALLGWDINDPIVLLCPSNTPVAKGLDFVRAAIARAKAHGVIRLVLLDGSIPPKDVPMYLNAGDCLAMASLHEGSPNIVKEALACNLPVVSVPVGDVPERLKGVYPSKVVDREVSQFADALTEVIALNQRSNGRERLTSCSEETIAEAISSIYEAIRHRNQSDLRVQA